MTLSISEARRIALAAQQFGARGGALRSVQTVANLATQLGAIQIDSVNVLVRSHYLPLFSRRGAYARELLERAAYDGQQRHLFEYWGHEASFLPLPLYPLMRWRMEAARNGEGTWKRLQRYATEHQELVDGVLGELRARGPLGAGDLAAGGRSSGGWWGWSQGKGILEWLFWTGVVTTAQRRNFERLYDLTERVLPAAIVNAPIPARADAQRELLKISARALGVATARDLRDYFRLPTKDAAVRIAELVEEGALEPVSVEGWKQAAFLCRGTKIPRSTTEIAALLSPFDSLIWERQRTERLFGFRYRLEIYTPAHKREHGYYVLPFLLGERLVARLDLKSDRTRSRLQVRGGSLESGVKVGQAVEPLRAQLSALSDWLGLERHEVTSRRGELLKALKRAASRPKASRAAAHSARERTDQPNRQVTRNKTK